MKWGLYELTSYLHSEYVLEDGRYILFDCKFSKEIRHHSPKRNKWIQFLTLSFKDLIYSNISKSSKEDMVVFATAARLSWYIIKKLKHEGVSFSEATITYISFGHDESMLDSFWSATRNHPSFSTLTLLWGNGLLPSMEFWRLILMFPSQKWSDIGVLIKNYLVFPSFLGKFLIMEAFQWTIESSWILQRLYFEVIFSENCYLRTTHYSLSRVSLTTLRIYLKWGFSVSFIQ